MGASRPSPSATPNGNYGYYSNAPYSYARPICTPKTKRNDDSTPSRKYARRGNGQPMSSGPIEVIDLTGDEPVQVAKPVQAPTSTPRKYLLPKTKRTPGEPQPEKRARVFRKHPPKTFLERYARATTQRLCCLGHHAGGSEEVPEMTFDIGGSTGNVYQTKIGKVPSCNCPDAMKGNHCKHIIYIMVNALKAPTHLQYQRALLSSELREIFARSPLSHEKTKEKGEENNDGNRKPIEGDCPICFMEFEPEKEEIVWCKAACGNNIHKTCFNQWAATKRGDPKGIRCVYCRSPWQTADPTNLDVESLVKKGRIGEDGYVNVADQLGLSGRRDYSTYSPWMFGRPSYGYSGYGRYGRY